MRKTTFFFCFLGFTAFGMSAQNLPVSNIWLFQTTPSASGWTLSNPQFLTGFNTQGYNNQPFFADDERLWITVQHGDQTDIHELNLAHKTHTPLVETLGTSEYSAGSAPDVYTLTVVRVETDGTQRLWAFPLDGGTPEPLFPHIEGVGYYAWLPDGAAALFIVGEEEASHTLVLAKRDPTPTERVSAHIGRCLRTLPDGKLVFVHKATEQTWFLKTYEPASKRFQILGVMPGGVEDFVLLPDNGFLCAEGSRLLLLTPDKTWKPVADVASYGILHVSRMAMNGQWKLALVAE
jgi:hypothetical protein